MYTLCFVGARGARIVRVPGSVPHNLACVDRALRARAGARARAGTRARAVAGAVLGLSRSYGFSEVWNYARVKPYFRETRLLDLVLEVERR
jgi:hypothetical protein